MATATLDKATYNKGDLITLTIVDAGRASALSANVPSSAGPIAVTINITTPQGTPTEATHTFTLKSDTPATGTSIWTTVA